MIKYDEDWPGMIKVEVSPLLMKLKDISPMDDSLTVKGVRPPSGFVPAGVEVL